jgi:hypothetical protein
MCDAVGHTTGGCCQWLAVVTEAQLEAPPPLYKCTQHVVRSVIKETKETLCNPLPQARATSQAPPCNTDVTTFWPHMHHRKTNTYCRLRLGCLWGSIADCSVRQCLIPCGSTPAQIWSELCVWSTRNVTLARDGRFMSIPARCGFHQSPQPTTM